MIPFLRNRHTVLLFLLCCLEIPGVKAQSLLNTTWRAVGQTGQSFKQSGIDTMVWQFMPGNALHWLSTSGTTTSVIYTIWNQTSANSFTFSFQDTTANNSTLSTLCPSTAVTTINPYHISGDTLYLDNVSGGCTVITSILASGTWKRQSATGVTGIPGKDAAVIIYPLPAQNTVSIRTGSYFGSAKQLTLSLYDQTGRKVKEVHATPGNIQWNGLEHLPAGVYALRLISETGLMATSSLVIAR